MPSSHDQVTFIQKNTCFNCYWEINERKKMREEPCCGCIRAGTLEDRFPKWRAEE